VLGLAEHAVPLRAPLPGWMIHLALYPGGYWGRPSPEGSPIRSRTHST